jgi:hypothetical protein
MYRICIAVNGYYYVQREDRYGWRKFGGFFKTRAGARKMINDTRNAFGGPVGKVVEYV